jgi:hypothetical protein
VTTTAIQKRLAAVEAAALRMLPREAEGFDPDDPRSLLGCLTRGELERLRIALEGDERSAGELWEDLGRRALGRAVMGVDVGELCRQEREGGMLLRFVDPDRPGAPHDVHYATYLPDASHPGRWHLDAAYHGQHPGLPPVMTTVEIERHDPTPWPPRALP